MSARLRILAFALIAASQSAIVLAQAPAAPPRQDTVAAPVYRPGDDGVTTPKLGHEVKPQYTSEAMQNRIEGTVLLESIVEPDGSVGPVRVLRSLDSTYGLDYEAVKAAKQWQFEPGLKVDVPVRVAVTLSMTFTLADGSSNRRLPAGFTVDATASDDWIDTAASAPGLKIRFSTPRGWAIGQPRNGNPVVAAQSDLATGRNVQLSVADSPVDLQRTNDPEGLRRLADMLATTIRTKVPGGRFVATGEGRLANRSWIWVELTSGSPAELTRSAAALPDPLRDAIVKGMDKAFDGAHIWMFFTTENHRRVSIVCTTFLRRGAADDERSTAVARSAPQFARLIDRVVIDAQP